MGCSPCCSCSSGAPCGGWCAGSTSTARPPGVATGGAPAADSPARPSMLMVSSDGQKPRSVRLDASTTIGRSVECELRLDDTFVSQQHARIFDRGGNWYVEDLGSTNGTFVNEQKLVAPAMLTPGDKIRIGTTIV